MGEDAKLCLPPRGRGTATRWKEFIKDLFGYNFVGSVAKPARVLCTLANLPKGEP